jgi:hypothetical protein
LPTARLPVSGTVMTVREPTGDDEVFVTETSLPALPVLLGLALRVTTAMSGGPLAWLSLPVADLVVAALIMRGAWLGDWIRTQTSCPGEDCGERIDVGFSSEEYLRHHRPRRARGVLDGREDGWFTLAGADVEFRMPTVADLLGTDEEPLPMDDEAALTGRLTQRCVRVPGLTRGAARRLNRAFAALAPDLDDLIGGRCPECGREVALRFDPVGYTLAELQYAFSGVYLEAHALASAYGWPESAILALPRSRRRRYAGIIASGRALT